MDRVGIIDCGISNLASVANAFAAVGVEPMVLRRPGELADHEHLVLPGVGAFGRGMANLADAGLVPAIRQAVVAGAALLGICLGMQLLGLSSEEFGQTPGLGLIEGRVTRLPAPGLRLPHVGWNEVAPAGECPIWRDVAPGSAFYFVHSYGFAEQQVPWVAGLAEYGGPVVAAVSQGRVHGVQFHPEKSQKAGLKVLENFVTLC